MTKRIEENRIEVSKPPLVCQLGSILAGLVHSQYMEFCKPENKLSGGWTTEGVSLHLDQDQAQKLASLWGVDNYIPGRVRVIATGGPFGQVRIIKYTEKGEVGIDILNDQISEYTYHGERKLSASETKMYLTSALTAVMLED